MASTAVIVGCVLIYLLFHAFCSGVVKGMHNRNDNANDHKPVCDKFQWRGQTKVYHPDRACSCKPGRVAALVLAPFYLIGILFMFIPYRAGQWLARRG